MIKVFAVAEEFGAAGCVCERVESCGNETPAWAEPVRRALRLVARRTPSMGGEAQAAVWKSERELAASLAAESAHNTRSLSNVSEAHGDAQAHCCSLARVE